MDMVISAGKSRKNVDAHVLTSDAKRAMGLFNATRLDVGVHTANRYIFQRMNSNGNTDLHKIVKECGGLTHPERISSIGLRRYIGTVRFNLMHSFYGTGGP
jgi:hypothetical protein